MGQIVAVEQMPQEVFEDLRRRIAALDLPLFAATDRAEPGDVMEFQDGTRGLVLRRVSRQEFAAWAAQMGIDVIQGPGTFDLGGGWFVTLDAPTWWVEVRID